MYCKLIISSKLPVDLVCRFTELQQQNHNDTSSRIPAISCVFVSYEGSLSAERLIVETMEIVRKEQEAQRAYEAEQAWLKAERERLADETESMKPMFKKHHDALMKIEADALAKKEVCSLCIVVEDAL